MSWGRPLVDSGMTMLNLDSPQNLKRYNRTMEKEQEKCQSELKEKNLIPKKYYGQVFTTNDSLIKKFIQHIKEVYKPGTKIIEIGGGLGYISEKLAEAFDDLEIIEYDEELFDILSSKLQAHSSKLTKGDILEYTPPSDPYLLVGNIPFHISGKLYRKFMSDEANKPYGMVFITDKQYAKTLAGQPPRCYRISLQAQAYGDIEILEDISPSSLFPEPKVTCCIMRIMQNSTQLPDNFWEVVNDHWERFPTPEVESPKTMGLERWLELCGKS